MFLSTGNGISSSKAFSKTYAFVEGGLFMGHWNEELLREIKAFASDAEKSGDGRNPDTEETLDPNEAVFRFTSRGVAVCRIVYDGKGSPVDYALESVNPAFGALFGVSSESVSGRRGSVFFADGGIPPSLDIFSRVVATGETSVFRAFFGKFRMIFDILAFSPKKNYFCAVFTDATDLVAAEKERRENDRFMESVLGNVDVWVVLLDEKGDVVFWNSAAERISGISAEEALSEKFDFLKTLCPDEQYRRCVQERMDVCRNGGDADIAADVVMRIAGGESRTVEWIFRPWRFEDIETEGVLLLGCDVTKIRRTEKKLRDIERRFATEFLESPTAMVLVDSSSGVLVDCNDAALSFHGYSREEMLALKISDLNLPSCERRNGKGARPVA